MTPTASWSPSASNLFHAFSFLNLDRSGLEDVLKTYGQDEYIGLNQDVLKASSRRLLKTKTKDVFKTSSRSLHPDECLPGKFSVS